MIAETITAAPQGARSEVLAALKTASASTGSDFDYLLACATRESGLDSAAKSKHSSATGLFQFLDQTWLGLVKRYGERHGLAAYANAIETDSKGRLSVASAGTKAAILALRKNPALSALMAGEAASDTKDSLEDRLGRDVCAGELYAAHFLGEGGACQLIRLNESTPQARADLAFPQAAKANRSVFYRQDGTPKTVSEVYQWAVDLPDAKSAPAMKTHHMAAPQPPKLDRALSTEMNRLAAWSPRQAFTHDENDNAPSIRRSYVPAAPVVDRIAPLLPSGLPQSPLLLNTGVIEMLSRFAPAGLRRG
jgi:hypothetical protein